MVKKQPAFFGYMRNDGSVGVRNYVAILPSVVCVNEVVEAIVANTVMTQGIIHHQGCCQTPPDLERVTECLIKIGQNPNVGAILIVSLGCEGVDTDRLELTLRETGKPVERINVQELGGTSAAIQAGLDKAQRLIRLIAGQQRVEVDMSHFTMGIKCGASDTTSGIASNPVIGYVADKVVDLGGTVIFGETTEFIGAEHILQRRAKMPQLLQISKGLSSKWKIGRKQSVSICVKGNLLRVILRAGSARSKKNRSGQSSNQEQRPFRGSSITQRFQRARGCG